MRSGKKTERERERNKNRNHSAGAHSTPNVRWAGGEMLLREEKNLEKERCIGMSRGGRYKKRASPRKN